MLTWRGRVLRMTERLLTCHRTEISRGWTARQHRQRFGRPRHSGGTPRALRESWRSGPLGARLGPAHSGMPLDNTGDNKPAVGVRANLTAIVVVSGTPWRWADGGACVKSFIKRRAYITRHDGVGGVEIVSLVSVHLLNVGSHDHVRVICEPSILLWTECVTGTKSLSCQINKCCHNFV